MTKASYSTAGFADRDVEAALDAISQCGFEQAEILGQEPHVAEPPTGRAVSEFRSKLDRRGLWASTVHAPLTRNVLGAPEEAWRREKVGVLASYLRFAGAIGSNEVIVHPVPNPTFVPDADDPKVPGLIKDAVPRSLDDLVPVAEEAGVRILMENLPYHCDYPLLTMKELRTIADAYPPERVGLVIDTGHAWTLKNDPVGEILAAGPRLAGTHLQDVDRDAPNDDHWLPTHGGLDWVAIRSALDRVNYSGSWTFEVARGRHGETQDELARQTRQIAASWGL